MLKQRFNLLNHLNSFVRKPKTGFTLVELLVAMVMAGIMVSVLLSIVINLLQTDQREASRNQTQGEMQSAMDYITSDLREAVYVYNDATKIKDYIPEFNSSYKPVLAFWKTNLISEELLKPLGDCSSFTEATMQAECNNLLLKRSQYSLIMYLQSKNASNSIWRGQSRIMRYELPKYATIAKDKIEQSVGYVDPSQENTSFRNWPKDNLSDISLQKARPRQSNFPVLTDFVDNPDNNIKVPICDQSNYSRTPPTSSQDLNTSFFACIRQEEAGFNQDVFIFLRGDAIGRPGAFGNGEFLPTLQTQVIVRGVIDKVPLQ